MMLNQKCSQIRLKLQDVVQKSPKQHQFKHDQQNKVKTSIRGLKKKSHWKEAQTRKYLIFLLWKGYIYQYSHQQKKKLRINVMMSRLIKTRTPAQCHTHHQKMMKKFGDINSIIRHQRLFYNVEEQLNRIKLKDQMVSESKLRDISEQNRQTGNGDECLKGKDIILKEQQCGYIYY